VITRVEELVIGRADCLIDSLELPGIPLYERARSGVHSRLARLVSLPCIKSASLTSISSRSSGVRAVDCRSTGPSFKSGWELAVLAFCPSYVTNVCFAFHIWNGALKIRQIFYDLSSSRLYSYVDFLLFSGPILMTQARSLNLPLLVYKPNTPPPFNNHHNTMATLTLLLILTVLLIFPRSTHAECIPCRYGASTVVCPQPAGVDPANAMTDFNCLCSKRELYESILTSCFGNSDLPSVCSADDTSEHTRIQKECKARESTSTAPITTAPKTEDKTKTETKTDTETVDATKTTGGGGGGSGTTSTAGGGGSGTTSTAGGGGGASTTSLVTTGGRQTTFVQGEETYTVTYYISPSATSTTTGPTTSPPKSGSIAPLPSKTDTPGTTAGVKAGEPKVGVIIGAAVGGVVGFIVLGIAALELRKYTKKRAWDKKVRQELKEVLRGHLMDDQQRELPRYRVAELAGERRVAELPG
jgi:hypothetical protein